MAKKSAVVVEPTAEQIEARELRRKEQEWRDATRGRSLAEAEDLIGNFWDEAARRVRNANRDYSPDRTTFHVERGWALEATVHVRLRRSFSSAVTDPQEPRRRAYAVRAEISLSWGATGRSPAAAIAAAALYREVGELACELEAVLAERPIYDVVES